MPGSWQTGKWIVSITLLLVQPAAQGNAQVATAASLDVQAHALDGDTLTIDLRLLGVDAFEAHQMCRTGSGQCSACGEAARHHLKQLLFQKLNSRGSKTVSISFVATSSYGRPMITALSDGTDVGLSLIRAGLAVPETLYLTNDRARAQHYLAAFAEAKAAKRGAHSGAWIKPSAWRRGQRLGCTS
jgi:micrococcal nuclease